MYQYITIINFLMNSQITIFYVYDVRKVVIKFMLKIHEILIGYTKKKMKYSETSLIILKMTLS